MWSDKYLKASPLPPDPLASSRLVICKLEGFAGFERLAGLKGFAGFERFAHIELSELPIVFK